MKHFYTRVLVSLVLQIETAADCDHSADIGWIGAQDMALGN